MTKILRTCLFIALAALLAARYAFSQSTLVLSSATVPSGGTAILPLTLTSPAGSEPAALQWTITYSPADIVALSATAGAAANAAGKALSCAASPGTYTCMLTGLNPGAPNTGIVNNGAVATVSATLSANTTSTSI